MSIDQDPGACRHLVIVAIIVAIAIPGSPDRRAAGQARPRSRSSDRP
jgi:hypothetical protein